MYMFLRLTNDCIGTVLQTRMQSLCPHPNAVYRSIYHAMTSMVTKEGLLAPLRGINVVALGAGPAHALYFSTYEATKQFINGNQTKYNPISHGRSSYHCRNYCIYCKLENKLDVIFTLSSNSHVSNITCL